MKRIFIICMSLYYFISIWGQDQILKYEVNNVGELQYNITDAREKDVKYVNLLSMEASLRTDKWWKNGSFDIAFWSVGRTFSHNIANDFLTFSNIEEDNFWLVCSKFGYQQTFGDFSLFAGIRNMNLDYFNSPYSSFFTNSSAGIFPTISINYSVPNYPLGAIGLHTEYTKGVINVKNSYYNNLDNVNKALIFNFKFNPQKYGFVNITQFAYMPLDGFYAAGVVLDKLPEESLRYSLYMLAEQSILQTDKQDLGIVAQLGYAPRKSNECYLYYGVGVVMNNLFGRKGRDTVGLNAFRANTSQGAETALEMSYKYIITSHISIQPALHYIHRQGKDDLVGLLRGSFTFGN